MSKFFKFKSSYKCIMAYVVWGLWRLCVVIGVLFSGFTRAFLLYALFWGALVYFDKREEDKRSRKQQPNWGASIVSAEYSKPSVLSSYLG
jgi:hypothetical protein